MAVTNTDITYTNGNSGRTRVNAQGLIVGVDFSTTSNTIATGSKTFTLAATANVNRDWPVGSSLVAVAQAGATGSMIGTVTSYDPATQVLVMNVSSITGSGTSTDWRIGSTAFRANTYDPVTLENRGQLIEGGATNLFLASEDVNSGFPTNTSAAMVRVLNVGITPDGSTTADKIYQTGGGTPGVFKQGVSTISGATYTTSIYAKAAGWSRIGIRAGNSGLDHRATVNLLDGSIIGGTVGVTTATALPNGWYRIAISGPINTTSYQISVEPHNLGFVQSDETPDGTNGILIWGAQLEISSVATSYIPTTTVSVTRAADQASITGTKFSEAFGPSGTLVMELTPIAQAVGAVAGSLNDGTAANAIRIVQKQSGTLSSIRKMATDGVTDVMAVNNSVNNTLVNNGVEFTEVATQGANAQFGVATSGLGKFLSVGTTESFRNSADSGLTYNARTIGGTFGGAHFGIGRFVLAGNTSVINGATVGSVIVSTDGLAFRRVNISGLAQALNEVTSNGTDQYVAVGNGGVIYTSPDAETWTPQTSGTATILTAVNYFSGRYVAMSSTSNASRYSDNGTSWTVVTGLAAGMNDVAHNGTNLWVAVGNGGAIYSSADGISWAVRTSNTTATLVGIHFADGLWVASGGAGAIVTSPDGTTWTDRTANSGTTQSIFEVGFFNGKFYYVGVAQVIGENSAANIVANVTWTARTANVTATLNGVAHNGSRLVICGSSGAITTSEDGITFTSRTGNAATLNGAAFGNGTYVIVGNAVNGSGLIATVNPTTFEYQRRISNTAGAVTGIKFLNGAFFATTTNAVLTSPDGVTWTSSASSGVSASPTWDGTYYIVPRTAGGIINYSTSATGAYTQATGIGTQVFQDMETANGIVVAVGNGGVIYTKTAGVVPTTGNWTLRTSGVTTALYSVMYSQRDLQWYAAGDGGVILRSADAITWTSIANDATVGIFTAGVLQANPMAGKFVPGIKNRVAITWDTTTGVSISVNGADAVSDASVTMPSITQYSIGMNGLAANHWNSTIKTQKAYRVKVSSAELQALARI